MPKRPDCYKPFCGVDGRLCPDCANYTFPGAGYTRPPVPSKSTLIDLIVNVQPLQMQPDWTPRLLVPNLEQFFRKAAEVVPLEHIQEDKGEARFKGFPVVESRFMPPGYGMLQTACHCHPLTIAGDGGAISHLAKKHTVLIVFGDDANEDKNPESSASSSA